MACCPYSDPYLVGAQVLSVLAFIGGSGGFYVTWVFGLIAMILLLCSGCCEQGSCMFHTAASFAVLAAVGQIFVLAFRDEIMQWCEDEQQDGQENDNSEGDLLDWFCDETRVATVASVGLVLWMLTAIFTWIFVCNRYPQIVQQGDKTFPPPRPAMQQTYPPPAGAAAAQIEEPPTITVTYLPDGTKQTERQTRNPDGSITVTVTTEATSNPDPKK